MPGRVGEGVAQVQQAGVVALVEAGEGVLGRAEALRDDVADALVDQRLLGVHHLGQAGRALGLGNRGLDQNDVRPGRDRVGVLDVEGGLFGPADLSASVGSNAGMAAELHDLNRGVRQPPLGVEHVEVILDRRRSERIDDHDRPPGAGDPGAVERVEVVGDAVLQRRVAVADRCRHTLRSRQRRYRLRGRTARRRWGSVPEAREQHRGVSPATRPPAGRRGGHRDQAGDDSSIRRRAKMPGDGEVECGSAGTPMTCESDIGISSYPESAVAD